MLKHLKVPTSVAPCLSNQKIIINQIYIAAKDKIQSQSRTKLNAVNSQLYEQRNRLFSIT